MLDLTTALYAVLPVTVVVFSGPFIQLAARCALRRSASLRSDPFQAKSWKLPKNVLPTFELPRKIQEFARWVLCNMQQTARKSSTADEKHASELGISELAAVVFIDEA